MLNKITLKENRTNKFLPQLYILWYTNIFCQNKASFKDHLHHFKKDVYIIHRVEELCVFKDLWISVVMRNIIMLTTNWSTIYCSELESDLLLVYQKLAKGYISTYNLFRMYRLSIHLRRRKRNLYRR